MTNSTHFHMYIYYKRERFPRTFLGVGAETLLPTGVSCFLFFLPPVSQSGALVAVLDFFFISARAGSMPGRCHRFFYFCLAGGWLLTIIRFHKFPERSEGTALVYNK